MNLDPLWRWRLNAYLALGTMCGRSVRPLARLFARIYAAPNADIQSGSLAADVSGIGSIPAQLNNIAPGGTIVVPAFFVGTVIKLPFGHTTLWSLSEFFYTKEAADHRQRQARRGHPNRSVLVAMLEYDPQNPEHRAELERKHRAYVLETTTGGAR